MPRIRIAAVTVACAAALAIAGCGGGDDGQDAATTTAPAPPPAANEPLWPPPAQAGDPPAEVARTFVTRFVGVENPALSEVRQGDPNVAEVDVYRRGEDGRALETVVASLALRRLEGERWAVMSAHSPEVELSTPAPRAEIASPVRIEGRGRGFEGNVVLEVREQYALEALAQEAVTAGSLDRLEPFSAELTFDAGGAATGAIVATTGSGIAAADGFAAFPVRFSRP